MALDEVRYPFSPTLFHLPKDVNGNVTAGASSYSSVLKRSFFKIRDLETNLQQCWFPGVHTNVGGGYPDQHLADLTLAWMIDKCRPFLEFDQTYIDMVCKLNHNPQEIHSRLRLNLKPEYPGYGMGTIYDSYYDDAMFLLGYSHRTPGSYEGSIHEKKVIGQTNEEMHASIRGRYQTDKKWRPKSLDGLTPVQDKDTGRWKWVKNVKRGKPIVIWEAEFEGDAGNFEHLLADNQYMVKKKSV